MIRTSACLHRWCSHGFPTAVYDALSMFVLHFNRSEARLPDFSDVRSSASLHSPDHGPSSRERVDSSGSACRVHARPIGNRQRSCSTRVERYYSAASCSAMKITRRHGNIGPRRLQACSRGSAATAAAAAAVSVSLSNSHSFTRFSLGRLAVAPTLSLARSFATRSPLPLLSGVRSLTRSHSLSLSLCRPVGRCSLEPP